MIDLVQEVTDTPIAVDSPSASVAPKPLSSVKNPAWLIPFPWKG